MCSVSAIYDYARQNIPMDYWTRPAFNDFQEIIRRLDKLDHDLNQPDCVDPEKAAFMERIEERLRKLEEKVGA